eukprot:COSAG01_NODE_411_length_17360_cov_11.401852_6_plen_173_part_00
MRDAAVRTRGVARANGQRRPGRSTSVGGIDAADPVSRVVDGVDRRQPRRSRAVISRVHAGNGGKRGVLTIAARESASIPGTHTNVRARTHTERERGERGGGRQGETMTIKKKTVKRAHTQSQTATSPLHLVPRSEAASAPPETHPLTRMPPSQLLALPPSRGVSTHRRHASR